MRNINFNHLSYGAMVVNLWILYVGFETQDRGIQLLAIGNMILLTLGLLLRPPKKKDDE